MTELKWLLPAVVLLAGCAGGAVVGEPLDCMKRFKMKDFVIGSWAFHDSAACDKEFLAAYKAAGFNTIIHCLVNLPADKQPPKEDYFGAVLDWADECGVSVIIHTARAHGPWGKWDGVKFPEKYATGGGYAAAPGLKWLHAKYGRHRSLVGYLVSDDAGVNPRAAECAEWLERNAPEMFPYISEVQDPARHEGTGVVVLSRQNYPWAKWDPKDERDSRNRYCDLLDTDRRFANAHDMAIWPILLVSERGSSASQLRFKALCPIAYGAQGIWWFAYSSKESEWRPGGRLRRIAAYCNEYIRDVAGPRVIGCRSVAIYQAPPRDGREAPGPGELIEDMDAELQAGVLVREKDLKAGRTAPAYVMVVDCRTAGRDRPEPPERAVRVKFGRDVRKVAILGRELIGAEGARPKVVSGGDVALSLKAGDGILLELNPGGE